MAGNATFRIVLSKLTMSRLTHNTARVTHRRSRVGVPNGPLRDTSARVVRPMAHYGRTRPITDLI